MESNALLIALKRLNKQQISNPLCASNWSLDQMISSKAKNNLSHALKFIYAARLKQK